MIESQARKSSDETLIDGIRRYVDAGAPIIQIRTREPLRAAITLRKHFTTEDEPYSEWSFSTGVRTFTPKNFLDNHVKGAEMDFTDALEAPVKQLRDPKSALRVSSDKIHYFAFLDPAPHLQNPYALDLIAQYQAILPTHNAVILFITEDKPLEMLPQGAALVAELPTPTAAELEAAMTRILVPVDDGTAGFQSHDLDEDAIRRIAVMGLGLSMQEFETHAALAIAAEAHKEETVLRADVVQAGIAAGKTDVVRSSEILELMHPEDMSNVGGMGRLKAWISQRAACYSQEARDFGVEFPKGIVLVGVPGVGKSLAAKATASELGVPLVRLDFAKIFSKYIGESEHRVRAALKMVEEMAPVVLFVDEIDKGLGGAGGSGDGGTSMRVLGTYLTWLQELKAPVFNIVTANRVDGLPPELLRRGRFDQIFSAAMPTRQERREVLAIHLRRRGHDIAKMPGAQIATFLDQSENLVPAEIESVVKDAIVAAFSAGEKLQPKHLLQELENLVPLFKSQSERIAAIIRWADENAISVNFPESQDAPVEEDDTPAPLSQRAGRAVRRGAQMRGNRK